MRGRHAPPRAARRSLLPSMLATGILAALATTGGVITVVGWTSGSTSAAFTVHAAAVPRVAAPAARAAARPRVFWTPVRIADDVPVERYVVTRHLGTVAQVACDIPATARPRCIDRFAPPGYRATYTVTARHGAHWSGEDSNPSAVVTTPGIAVPISVNGMLIVPGTGGTPVVVGAASPSAGPSVAAAEPSSEPSAPAGEIAEPPVVYVPPAPPVPAGPRPDDSAPAAEKPDKDPPGRDSPDKEPPGNGNDKPETEPATESATVPKEPDPAVAEPTAASKD